MLDATIEAVGPEVIANLRRKILPDYCTERSSRSERPGSVEAWPGPRGRSRASPRSSRWNDRALLRHDRAQARRVEEVVPVGRPGSVEADHGSDADRDLFPAQPGDRPRITHLRQSIAHDY